MNFVAKSKAVFLDRDGTIIHDVGYPKDPSQVELLPGIVESLNELQKYGFKLIIISNQSGIGRGILTVNEVEQVNQKVMSSLDKKGVLIDASYYCPHAPDENCACRKPSPEMLLRAAKELNIDLAHSFMVGDKLSDIEAGKRATCRTILLVSDLMPETNFIEPDAIVDNWQTALSYILNHNC